jgi:uncharacterized membrane protein YhdT
MLTDTQIFDILDGIATAEMQQQHSHLLANSPEYKANFQEIEALHLDLVEIPMEQTSPQFTENVLTRIVYAPVKKKSWSSKLTHILFGVMASVLVTVIVFAFFNLSTTTAIDAPTNHWFEMATTFLTDTFVKTAILANLIVLLVIFDRKVLKPYFNHRKMRLG